MADDANDNLAQITVQRTKRANCSSDSFTKHFEKKICKISTGDNHIA